jgi:hypothetical protein
VVFNVFVAFAPDPHFEGIGQFFTGQAADALEQSLIEQFGFSEQLLPVIERLAFVLLVLLQERDAFDDLRQALSWSQAFAVTEALRNMPSARSRIDLRIRKLVYKK